MAPFDFHRVFIEPWSDPFIREDSIWIVVLGFLVGASCGLLGNFLLLRRMALAGDAISHSVLPGLVLAYILFGTMDSWVLLLGAAVAGVVAVLLVEFLQQRTGVKADAATGIAFTSLFALGVWLIGKFAGRAHIDADCVLFGSLELSVFAESTPFGHVPKAVIIMVVALLSVAVSIFLFYKELLITSFDPAHASTLGIRGAWVHYLLMAAVSVVVVASLRLVGVVLVVGMIILPPATAQFFSHRLPVLLGLSVGFALLGAVLGRHLSHWWEAPVAACMAVASGAVFGICWLGFLLHRWWRRLSYSAAG